MENTGNIDIEKIEWAFKRVAPRVIREYLGPLGFDIGYQSQRLCEAESRCCMLTISIQCTKIMVELKSKSQAAEDMLVECTPADVCNEMEIEQEIRRQLDFTIYNHKNILCGE